LQYDDVFFPAADGTRLHGWFVAPARGSPQATLLWFHGNAGNISHRLENIALLHRFLPISTFIFDYREFGLSEGQISKEGTLLDARGAWQYLLEQRKLDPRRILLFGRSLGTALAVYLASRQPCLGVILEAAFTSSRDMLHRYFPQGIPPELSRAGYDNLTAIRQVRAPVLFIHAQYDEAIPVEMARRLSEAVAGKSHFYLVPGASHNDTYLVGGSGYFQVWQSFLRECLDLAEFNSSGG